MYSVVLMMSLTGSMDVPDFGRRRCSCSCSGYSSCSGCHGGRRARGCHGCCGGYSSGCCGGHSGCGGGCHGGGYPGGPGMSTPGYRAPSGERVPAPKKTQAEEPATVRVTLPADARLLFGDHPTTSTSSERRFITPPLPPGSQGYYTLKAEVVRNGQTRSAVQRVVVRAGQETSVTFDFAPDRMALAP